MIFLLSFAYEEGSIGHDLKFVFIHDYPYFLNLGQSDRSRVTGRGPRAKSLQLRESLFLLLT